MDGNNIGKCPVMHGSAVQARNNLRGNRDWWPNQLNLKILHQNTKQQDPFGGTVSYKEQFEKLDYNALKADLTALMTDSQDWW
ncbi:MAG: catalase-peroxidase, partial [Pseudomonadota bacterium]